MRQLALHRLSNTKVLDVPAKEPDDFDFTRYTARAQKYQPQGSINLVALFGFQAADHLKETPVSRDQTLSDAGNNKLELKATVECDETLRWWIRAFGSQVEIKEPRFLRDEMRDDVEKMMKLTASISGSTALTDKYPPRKFHAVCR